jgi:hypothetical protein
MRQDLHHIGTLVRTEMQPSEATVEYIHVEPAVTVCPVEVRDPGGVVPSGLPGAQRPACGTPAGGVVLRACRCLDG